MLETLKNSLGVWWEMVLLLVGAVLPLIYDSAKKNLTSRNRKKAIKSIGTSTKLNIDTIQSADPDYKNSELRLEITENSFYLEFPSHKIHLINQQYENFNFHPKQYFSKKETDDVDLAQLFPSELRDYVVPLIEKYREMVADDFIQRKNGCHFNSDKLGVDQIREEFGIGHKEKNAIHILLYHTDYYTHRVMKAVYKELLEKEIYFTKDRFFDSHELSQLRAFLTSIGVNIILVMDDGQNVILSQRSHRSAHSENAGKFNSTAMEGITLHDRVGEKNNIYVDNVIDRAIEEEIGIQHPGNKKRIYDVFLEKNYFEIGITASVELEESFEETVKHSYSKDGALEIKKLVPVYFNQSELNEFVATNDFMQQGLYTLKMVAARKNIIIKK
ncbi:hypothetical protein EVJ27_06510 [Exiguobacterium sp. SH3S2]|uniref:hypothetical protein n=1 Tax=unclassified Exiguobacterium TaxID=2644629 RepID=UPI00103BF93A|nr:MULTISPECIES: hypothetical protein [unclassified Exiguobacterium]TCI46137.1 hypothetical protein EVJ28_06505 [Exiguobacterium sp. SH3S3]TCI61225.1 hypothetical protein EVJ27_06510 [Exiguobacterium sp. SH3S2]